MIHMFMPFLLGFWGSIMGPSQSGPSFMIDPGSTLEIHGSSNVNTFICLCRQSFVPMPWSSSGDLEPGQGEWRFKNTRLTLQTQLFDCGKKVMNKDFYLALKAKEHPRMQIELQSIEKGQVIGPAWTTLATHTLITIAGRSRQVPIHAKVRRLTSTKLQVIAEKPLKMTDFGIHPPTALMGMIKTNDDITIHMNLILHILG